MSSAAAETEPTTPPAPETTDDRLRLPSDPPETVIRAQTGWRAIDAAELWRFRELIYFLAWRDVKIRYKQTVLGAAWAVLQPALMMVVFTIFFGRIAGVYDGPWPYPLFAYAGLLPWMFFASALVQGGNSVVGSERLITKIYFPRLAVPFASVAAAVVDFTIAMGLLAVIMAYYRVAPGWTLLLAPVVFAAILLMALGMATLLAALNVAYRDFRYVVPFLVQLWMFATPAVYMQVEDPPPAATATLGNPQSPIRIPQSASRNPQSGTGLLRAALAVNPMNGLIASFRAAVLGGPIPWAKFATATACAAVVFVVGCLYFRRVEDTFADII